MADTRKTLEDDDATQLRARVQELEAQLSVSAAEHATPVVIDAGKTKRKRIKELKRGTGKLMAEVLEAVDEVGRGLGKEAEGKVLVPVVLIYKKRGGRRGRLFPF